MSTFRIKSIALGFCVAALALPAVCSAEADCDALIPGGVGLERDLTGMSKSQLEQMLSQVQQQQAELGAFRAGAQQTIKDLVGEDGTGGQIGANEGDMLVLRNATLKQLEKNVREKHANEPEAQIAIEVQNLKTRFETDQEYRHSKMTNAYQIIRQKIADGSAPEPMKQRFETVCQQYADFNKWETGIEDQKRQLASAKAVLNPDCWSSLQRKFAVAITTLQSAMNESAELDLSGVNGMIKKIEEGNAQAAENMRATLRYLEVQDTAARALLIKLEAYMKAMAGKWQAPPADMLKELEKFAQRTDRGTVGHYNTLITFMEMAEETAAPSYWQQQLNGRTPSAELLETYAGNKRAFSESRHSQDAEGQPHRFVGHDAYRDYATKDEEGKKDDTARAVRDLLAAP